MEDSVLSELSAIEEMLKAKPAADRDASVEKLYELLDMMCSGYLGLPSNGTIKNCITGDNNHLYTQIKRSCRSAVSIDIIVAFIMESGARLLADDLKEAADRGVKIRILTGSYLNITQPHALYLLKDKLGEKADLRLYQIKNKSFHPKAYIFEYDADGDIYLGSSNISLSAMTSGIEWNFRINKLKNNKDFTDFKAVFEDLFENCSIPLDDNELRRYSSTWKKPKVYDDVEKLEEKIEKETLKVRNDKSNVLPLIRPKGAQIEALYELKKCRAEGFDRALVVAATGIGKTYLAAFDSAEYSRILFVAHRDEILMQAEKSFKSVKDDIKTGFFNGEKKDGEYDILFASVQSLGKEEYLSESYFPSGMFDYIIIDEFHHAAAGSYTKILDYFKPKFLLGLTATPERLDNKDVFALCDYNVVYEARLKDAINKGWLVPFRYYGIYDDIDYGSIEYRNGKYNDDELEKALMINKRAKNILNHYKKYGSRRALGFCTSRNHASYMAKHFCENGVKACAVVSGGQLEYSMDRSEAISKLNSGEINIIFSVDMFNEGLDVPSIDMVLFLRPTQSPTVFYQQLGRGLRKSAGKKYLNVLDFIGNYKKALHIPFLLCGELRNPEERFRKNQLPKEEEYPDDCIIDFDFRIIDIFRKQAEAGAGIQNLVKDEYFRIRDYLGKRPLRLDMFTYMDDDLLEKILSTVQNNIFNNYLGFLKSIEELSIDEEKLIDTEGHKFLIKMETTPMARSYKMPLLLAFYNDGKLKMKVNEDDIFHSFYEFFSKPSNAVDLLKDKGGQNYKSWGRKEYLAVANNPVDAFMNSGGEYFYEAGNEFCMNESLSVYRGDSWFMENLKDVIDYRVRRYYKNRVKEKFKEDLVQIKYTLRDERINILAMTDGKVPAKHSHQVILCKKSPIPDKRKIFLLDAKKSEAQYKLSDAGNEYLSTISTREYRLNYVSYIDSQIKVPVSRELFEILKDEGYFSIWEPDAPVNYFADLKEGYLVLFRVYRIRDAVDEELLEDGRKGRNYYFKNSEIVYTKIINPVINDNDFDNMKNGLIELLKSRKWLLDIL